MKKIRKKQAILFCLVFLLVIVIGGFIIIINSKRNNENGELILSDSSISANNIIDESSVEFQTENTGDFENHNLTNSNYESEDENNYVEDEALGAEEELSPEELAEAEELEFLYSRVSENRVSVLDTEEEGVVHLTFAGDILFDKGYAIYSTYLNRGSQIENCISEDLLDLMRSADVMMLNNEFPYTDRGAPTPDKIFTFHAPTEAVSLLDDMGVDIVTLANNHASDYGQISLLDSMDTLDAAGMPFLGAGHNIDEASAPYYFESDGYTIGIVSATQIERYAVPATPGATENSPGVFRCLDPERLIATIQEAKENADFVILYIHWGTESTDVLDWCQNDQAPKYVAAGVDLIIGDHPHVLQEVGYINGVPIVYSLGNFWFNSKTLDTCVVTATIREGELESLQFIPCLQSGCSTRLLDGAEKQRVINYMRSISGTATIDDDGFISPR